MTIVDTTTGEVVTPLSDTEQMKLDAHEQTIEASKSAIGKALAAIRDGRLYRETHSSFEVYCRERWGISRPSAYRQIDAYEVSMVLSPIGDKEIPESQARELAPLRDDPERMREVYEDASRVTNGRPTAAAIRQVRDPQPPRYEPDVVEAELVEDDPDPIPRPSPEAQAAHERERIQQQQREDHSRDFAKIVWLLNSSAEREDAADYLVGIWQPLQDIYPAKTTADRIRKAADYLHDIADRWDP